MYWHIDTDIVALIVICVLYYYTVKMLPNDQFTAQNRGFLWCLRCGVVMTVIDIVASIIMEVPTTFFLYQFFMIAYLLIQDLMIVSWFLYSLTILYQNDEAGRRRLKLAIALPYAIYAGLVLSNPWTEIFFSLGPNLEYTREPLFLPLVLGLYSLYAVGLLVLIFIRRHHIPAGYPKLILILQPIILGVAIPIQLLNAGWLLVFSAYMICLVLAFLFFQNVRVRNERAQLGQLTELVENFASGLVICEVNKERELKVVYISSGYCEIFEGDSATLTAQYSHDLFAGIHPDDREYVKTATDNFLQNLTEYELSYRYITSAGNLKWINTKMRVVRHTDGTATSYSTYTDLTEQYKARQQLSDVIQTVPCGICLYRWDGKELCPIIANNQFSEMLGVDTEEYLNSKNGLDYSKTHPDDLERCQRDAYIALMHTHEIDTTYRSFNDNINEYMWIRMRGRMVSHADGSQFVYVSYYDVTQEHKAEQQLREGQKELQTKYELEKRRASIADESLLVHAIFNLTSGEVLEYCYRDGSEVPPEDRTIFAYGEQNAGLLIDEEERAQFLALNHRGSLLERFAAGETEFRLDYRRLLPNGEVTWVRSLLHLVRDPDSGDVLLFEYWHDVEEEKMLELMYRRIASDSYDFVARINGKTKTFVVFPKLGTTYRMPPSCGADADAVTLSAYNDNIHPDDRETAIHNLLVDTINENLRKNERFQFIFRELQEDGSTNYKKITQYYIDPQREIIAMMREDVTDLIREEAEKNKILADALASANQASSAKSQFLSRVSHELRTPLNAIIGFMELARDVDEAQAKSYMANADAAAKQLLSIINDVLDVSSIESGKMRIAHAPFDLKHLIQSITNIYVQQCLQKGLNFETRLLTEVDEWLLGDQLRVNQILLNLLNNAVKFTTEGHIRLSISQRATQDHKVVIRFEVADSGCGMSEQMQARLFRPFEQESASTAQKYGGNGLGLSIVGSLVQMMGGVVHVESRRGEGSTFIVDLPFTKSEAEVVIESIEGAEDLHVLAVDDEEGEREYISIVLERIGVRHTCVAGGLIALDELAKAEAAGDAYNICLVDWKMPNLNGIETTRRIREKYGDDVVVIVVSAYDHYQAGESAKMAGANMFISKPLFQSSLFDLFATLTGGRIARKEVAPVSRLRAGARVLLAEDNAMNRMVAEGLIERLGVDCETAEDGRIAVDMFLAAPPGHYDAILMDIQMPNLDGYEATRLIRESSHPHAKTVQIIALTANAFNEDIARSLSSGMNDHVAKPIEPDVLTAALNKAFAKAPDTDHTAL